MTNAWNPSFWADWSGPGVAVLVCAAFVWALATERLVLGKLYRAERERANRVEAENRTLTSALIEKNTLDTATLHLVAAVRDVVSPGGAQ